MLLLSNASLIWWLKPCGDHSHLNHTLQTDAFQKDSMQIIPKSVLSFPLVSATTDSQQGALKSLLETAFIQLENTSPNHALIFKVSLVSAVDHCFPKFIKNIPNVLGQVTSHY